MNDSHQNYMSLSRLCKRLQHHNRTLVTCHLLAPLIDRLYLQQRLQIERLPSECWRNSSRAQLNLPRSKTEACFFLLCSKNSNSSFPSFKSGELLSDVLICFSDQSRCCDLNGNTSFDFLPLRRSGQLKCSGRITDHSHHCGHCAHALHFASVPCLTGFILDDRTAC